MIGTINTHRLWLIQKMSRYHGVAKIVLPIFGVIGSIAIKLGVTQQLIMVFVGMRIVMSIYTYKHWKIKWVAEPLFNLKRKKKTDSQLIISSLILSTGSVFIAGIFTYCIS